MSALLWLALALPAVAALAVRAAPHAAATPLAVLGAAGAALPAWALLIAAATGEAQRTTLTWLPAAGLEAGLRLDGLSAAMSATVATVGLAVLVYSTGYFAEHDRARSALAGLLGFLAAMQGLVLADGYLALLVFWELVGACSMRLIAFSREDAAAAGGAVRAFLTTRAADLGFYVALLALYAGAGTLAFGAERPDGALGALVGLGLVVAAAGKSAQAPLSSWLFGAMAGPTPVSALLHSATMVAAGVYLLVRSDALLAGWPLEAAGWIGALTAVAGAVIALAQRDLKRVLAGSTTSQLGLMFVGAAAGGPAVAVFHLVAHAAGKALLFLTAGVFGHARGGTALADVRGAGRDDRTAFALWCVGALSIAGIPPLAAFLSKDHILAAAEEHLAWFVLALVATAGSAAYLLRPTLGLWDRAAPFGPAQAAGRGPMLAGAGALAGASLLLAVAGDPLRRLLDAPALPSSILSIVLTAVAIAAGAVAVLRAVRPAPALVSAARRQLYAPVLLRTAVERPAMLAAEATALADTRVVDAAVDGVGRGGLALARAEERLETHGIDATVDGLARAIGRGGERSRRVQTGVLDEYLLDTVLGAAAVGAVIALAALL